MTVREYIVSAFQGLSIPESCFADMSVSPDAVYSTGLPLGPDMVAIAETLLLAPSVKSVNENGFSMAWDTNRLGKYYMYLCKKYGIAPNPDLLGVVGLNVITDKTDIW